MENKNKDKIIIILIAVIAILFANNLVNNHSNNFLDEKHSFFDKSDDLILEDNQENLGDKEDVKESSDMKVHISGEINQEGVYTINEGDRLDDLIKEAGGLTEEANADSLNLAMKLNDQMKIYIPNKNEAVAEEDNPDQIVTNPNESNNSDKININQASKEELMTLPNVGEKKADAIIEYRDINKFESIEDIKNVTGIGDKYFNAMKDLITI
ncbi:DUF655 domain-containing protein [uncultured Anaerococcus sp.]|uniref:DUF655 domain-containing protein n=1 Tax=uncultured Anaerococcus sp. TaxID=293428 RepID=UPI0026278219|nr:DUF655 domain-containing protein [uncultured Anaerococcus sp.]